MYLHIGNGKTVRLENIVGIFDLDNATVSGISKRFITEAQKRGEVEYDYADLPRGFVLTDEGKKSVRLKRKERYKVYLSRISTSGLMQRVNGEDNS